MRLRRRKKPAPPQPAPAAGDPTALQPAPATPPASSGPGPVAGTDPAAGPHPPITGKQPAVGAAATQAPERDEGLRPWVAQVDRKLGTRTYAGAALVVLALAASIVAIVLAIDARDNSAGEDDLSRVESQLSTVSELAGAGESAQTEVDSLDARLSTLEDQISEISTTGGGVAKQITVIEDDIEDLRQQISDGGGDGSTP